MTSGTTTKVARCRCGELSIECEGEPERVSVCHCLECQRRTGSAFGVSARFRKPLVTVKGIHKTYERIGETGLWARYHFCPECGSTAFYENEDLPRFYAVPVGAFADPDFTAPQRSGFERRKHGWVEITGQGITREK